MLASTVFLTHPKKRGVVALGRSGVDLYPDQFGPMNQVVSFSKYVGGSPANTAVQMAKMGVDVGFISKASQDHFGQYVKYYLASEGIDVSHMTDVDDPSIRHSLPLREQPELGSINYFSTGTTLRIFTWRWRTSMRIISPSSRPC